MNDFFGIYDVTRIKQGRPEIFVQMSLSKRPKFQIIRNMKNKFQMLMLVQL